jgi:hypothetical protein
MIVGSEISARKPRKMSGANTYPEQHARPDISDNQAQN